MSYSDCCRKLRSRDRRRSMVGTFIGKVKRITLQKELPQNNSKLEHDLL